MMLLLLVVLLVMVSVIVSVVVLVMVPVVSSMRLLAVSIGSVIRVTVLTMHQIWIATVPIVIVLVDLSIIDILRSAVILLRLGFAILCNGLWQIRLARLGLCANGLASTHPMIFIVVLIGLQATLLLHLQPPLFLLFPSSFLLNSFLLW
jgi:hypothetical protein